MEQAVATAPQALPFSIRGHGFTILSLRVIDPWNERFFMMLSDFIAQAPQFYRNAPVVIDFAGLDQSQPLNMAEFCRRLRQLLLVPIGVQNGSDEWSRLSVNAGLSIFAGGREAPLRQGATRTVPEPAPEPAASPSRLVTEPVRSGQQVYAPGGDLTITASVSNGAEVIADGSIHVYGSLRGRALAGLGDPAARIFCQKLEAELVSIAGVYLVSEQIDRAAQSRPVQIRLDGERLLIEPLGPPTRL